MNKTSILQVSSTIANNQKYSYLIVFSVAVILKLVPEILAFPNPIGYDVINYYLPILKNFDKYWPAISNQFPLYVSLLHTISSVLNVDPRIIVTPTTVLIFGLFSVVIFSISKNLFHLFKMFYTDILESIFLR